MEYQNTDKAARRQAYERVKQLAEAIKKIRKKYYLCFNKISDADKQRYEQLISQMQSVASENGLEKSYVQLMSDIEVQYKEQLPNGKDEKGMPSNNSIEEAYQMYLKAVQLVAECIVKFKEATDPKLEKAYMQRAQKIQSYIKNLANFLEKSYSSLKLRQEKMNVLSEKFAAQTKGKFGNLLKSCYSNFTAKDPTAQQTATSAINECRNTLSDPTPEIPRA